MTEETDHDRIIRLEEQVKSLQKAEQDRADRDRYVIGTIIALVAVIVAVVLPFIVTKGGA
jgi:hypothetical protein